MKQRGGLVLLLLLLLLLFLLFLVGVVRFARVGCPRCGAAGMHLARLRTCALNPAWTAGFRGRSVKFVRAALAGRVRRVRMHAGNALDGPVLRLAKYTPAAPLVHPGGWDKNTSSIFLFGLGSVGPSRPRHCPRPARARASGLDANDASARRRSFS
jgi:hypothetical protein